MPSTSLPSTSLPQGGQLQPQQPSFLHSLQSNQLSSLAALLKQQMQQPQQQALSQPQQLTGLEAQARSLEEALIAQAQQQRLSQNVRTSRTQVTNSTSAFSLSLPLSIYFFRPASAIVRADGAFLTATGSAVVATVASICPAATATTAAAAAAAAATTTTTTTRRKCSFDALP